VGGCNATSSAIRSLTRCAAIPTMSGSLRSIRAKKGPLVAILPRLATQEVTHNLQWVPQGGRRSFIKKCPTHVLHWLPSNRIKRNRQAAGRAEQAADRDLRGQNARTDAACRLRDVGFRLRVAGIALSHHADGHPLLDQPGRRTLCRSFFRKVKYITTGQSAVGRWGWPTKT